MQIIALISDQLKLRNMELIITLHFSSSIRVEHVTSDMNGILEHFNLFKEILGFYH